MAPPQRTKNPSVAEQLVNETYRFEFYQAVRLLHQLKPDAVPVADGTLPEQEPVRFSALVSTQFPASDLDSIVNDADIPLMKVNFMGLAGAHGPLPPPYTELILERLWYGDTTLRDFLDIFHHRLISLVYRTRSKLRIGLETQAPWQSRIAHYLFALMGLDSPKLHNRMQVEEHALLFYTGLFAHQARSLATLEHLLSDFFQIPVTHQPFVGQWLALPPEEYTYIGVNGQNQRLGQTATAGTRVWEQQSKFGLQLGPMNLEAFLNFLPIGWGFLPLCELTRFFTGDEHDVAFNLQLKAAEIPQAQLSSHHGSRLGWTSWLNTTPHAAQDACVTLSPKLFYGRKTNIPLLSLLPQDELKAVLAQMTPHQLPQHTVVVRQGEVGASLFVIKQGTVQVLCQDPEGRQRLLAILKEGEFFGEMSFLTAKPRSATVITTTVCEILELSKQHLTEIIEKHPRVKQALEQLYRQRQIALREYSS